MKSSSKNNDLTDNRIPYDYATKFPSEAWKFIWIEAGYLAVVLITTMVFVVLMVAPALSAERNWYFEIAVSVFGQPSGSAFQYIVVAKFGLVGGSLFDIKWLIHSVAKGSWHRDRILWRLFTPVTSGVTAVFFALIVQSGIISLFDPAGFRSIELAGAFGMLVGYFADGVIGVLSNLAGALFGTVQDRREKNADEKKEGKGNPPT